MTGSNIFSRTMRRMLAMMAGQHFGGERDLYQQFGYPRNIPAQMYLDTYARADIAGRLVDAYPEATWREAPVVKSKDAEPGGPFEVAFAELAERVKLWNVLTRLDRLMNLGHYGVLFLGLDGAEPADQPTQGNRYRLMYLTPHGETSAQITKWDSEPKSPRYAKPEMYSLTAGVGWTGYGAQMRTISTHWSRTIHVAERTLGDESIGTPRLERVFNRLMDLDKLIGGGAEVYWQNAAAYRAWKAEADAEWDEAEKADMIRQLEELSHGLRRDVRLRGVEPEILAATFEDPSLHVDKVIDLIAGASGVPKRILLGTERGELSSEQDEQNWTSRVTERRLQVGTPMFVRPLVQRLIGYGVLPEPEGGEFEIIWPESDTLGESARAEIASKKASAVATYVSAPGAELVVPPQEFRRWLGEAEESEFKLVPLPDLDEDDEDTAAAAAELAANRLEANATPRTLYVRRNVTNWRELAAWAKGQGFETTVGEAMHVTIAFSRQPVDWLKVREAWTPSDDRDSGQLVIAAGGPRLVEPLGPNGAVVLFFAASELSWRHREILECGASWDFADFQPHVTITYKAGAVDLKNVEPYRGALVLGPELFEEVEEDWKDGIVEA